MPNGELDGKDVALLELARTLRATGYQFTTVTPATHGRVNQRPGNERARNLAEVFGWSRPFDQDILPPAIFGLMREAGILLGEPGTWRSAVRLSSLHGELIVHSAFPTTDAGAVFFGPDTYRFAGAILGALDARKLAVTRAVDIGCGAGPGAIMIAKERPDARVFMADINHEALRLARINAALAGAENTMACLSNLLTGIDGEFDLIVSNPPYLLDPLQRSYRHGGGSLGEGLSLAILRASLERLRPGGTLLLYTGVAVVNGLDPFRDAAERLLAGTATNWTYRELDPDVFGEELAETAYGEADRIAAVVLDVTRTG